MALSIRDVAERLQSFPSYVVKRAANQVASVAADTAGIVTGFNTLLASLKTAGIVAPDA